MDQHTDDPFENEWDEDDDTRDEERDDGRLRDRCVLGADSNQHGPDECASAEMVEDYEPELGGEA